jgi:hypothetical protein
MEQELMNAEFATTRQNELINKAVEEVFDDWMRKNFCLNYDALVASLIHHGLIRFEEDSSGNVIDVIVSHRLTEEQGYRVTDGIDKCIEYVLESK